MERSSSLTTIVLAAAMACALVAAPARAADGGGQPGLQLRMGGPAFLGTTLVDFDITLPRTGWLGGWTRGLADPATSDLRAGSSWALPGVGGGPRTGGLRASGGVVGVSRHAATGPHPGGHLGTVDLSLAGPRNAFAQGLTVSVPYIGIGYSASTAPGLAGNAPARSTLYGGWGFSADVGLMALSPRSAVRFDRVLGGQQSLDEVLRDVRLTPLLQLGVTYTF